MLTVFGLAVFGGERRRGAMDLPTSAATGGETVSARPLPRSDE
jgi:hypothetical protein